jgi:hypothetical protein
VYTNIHAGMNWETHFHKYDIDSPIVQDLQTITSCTTDMAYDQGLVRVQLVARSMYPGWVNNIAEAKITIKYVINEDALKFVECINARILS